MTLGLCMIVRDEEEVLGRCLDSVASAVDQIVIVDTGSRDRTKEIARGYTDRVYDFTWIDDFAAARNFAFAQADTEYLMWLDADDVLEADAGLALKRLRQTLAPQTDMVMLPYHVAFDAGGRPTFTYYRERIVRRAFGYRWVGAVHEVIPPAGNVIYAEDIPILHRKLKPGDPDRNLRIFEGILARGEQPDARQQYYYGRELFYHARYEEAAGVFRAFLDGGDGWIENCIGACGDLAACYEALGRPEQALEALLRSFAFDIPRACTCCALGAWFLARERVKEAIFWYELAPTRARGSAGGFEQADCYGYLPCIQLCVCYDKLGDHETACQYNERAAQYKPDDACVRYNRAWFASLGMENTERGQGVKFEKNQGT